jgi:hypothetical protein
MQHLTDDDLVLHYYGELDAAGEGRVTAHLSACAECHRRYVRLQRVMATVDTMPVPGLNDGFERTVWARLEPALQRRRGTFSWLMLSPASLAWVGAILVLVAGAFFAGRMTRQQAPEPKLATADQLREGVLLVDLEEHLERSQTMLVELVSADVQGEEVDLTTERERAEDLVAANRLYRQATGASGDLAVRQLLDELERLLIELAASPDHLSTEDLARVQQRIAAKDLLFKVRVVSSALKERQKQQIAARATTGET